MASNHNSKRLILVYLVNLALLTSCGANNNIAVAEKTIRAVLFPASGPEIDRTEISNLPYAMITARVGKGPYAVLVLADSLDGVKQWMATNAVSVVTKDGRLVRTVGFPHDLSDQRIYGRDPLANAPHRMTETANYKIAYGIIAYGIAQSDHVNLLFDCSMSVAGPEKIEIAELIFETIKLEERCQAPNQSGVMRKNISNTYWVDIFDGYVWQSRQQWDRDHPAISLSVLKPEG